MRAFVVFILSLFGIQTQIPAVLPVVTPTPYVRPSPTPVAIRSVQLEVPFTSQAPFGEWSDQRYQDACEEASVIMAVAWARGETLEPVGVKQTIAEMAAFQLERYGTYVDTSVEDSLERLFKGYFDYSDAVVVEVESKDDIVRALVMGKLVMVPTNGKLLGNPNFVNGGPERHNLIITGYDMQRGEFVTHDPGTRQGKGYRYSESVMMRAIRDYVTGDHAPILSLRQVMIVISKPSLNVLPQTDGY